MKPSLGLISSAIERGEEGAIKEEGEEKVEEEDSWELQRQIYWLKPAIPATQEAEVGRRGLGVRTRGRTFAQPACAQGCGFNTHCQEKHPRIDRSVLCSCK
jgi:hypothetical protein